MCCERLETNGLPSRRDDGFALIPSARAREDLAIADLAFGIGPVASNDGFALIPAAAGEDLAIGDIAAAVGPVVERDRRTLVPTAAGEDLAIGDVARLVALRSGCTGSEKQGPK